MRLIDADALVENRDLHIVIGAGDNICIDIADISKAPTIDAAPVVRGHWVDGHGNPVRFDGRHDGFVPVRSCYCSVCGDWLTASDEYPVAGAFCPACGADMRGDHQ